jgi:hypothetical protein
LCDFQKKESLFIIENRSEIKVAGVDDANSTDSEDVKVPYHPPAAVKKTRKLTTTLAELSDIKPTLDEEVSGPAKVAGGSRRKWSKEEESA